MNEKDALQKAWEREFPITFRLLKAFPADSTNFKPHEKSKTATEVAWNFVNGQRASQQIWEGTFTPVPNFPPAPKVWNELISSLEEDSAKHMELLRKADEADLYRSIQIVDPYAGRFTELKEFPSAYFLWFLLNDHVHHRGQLSVYLRSMGGKVPSIYGPSGDDPWRR